MRNAPPDAAVERFRADLEKLIAADGRLGVAVSGGPDSVALLLLCANAFPGRTFAATVDHRLRKEGADEAACVAELCRVLGVPHRTLTISETPDGNVSNWARQVRYRALDAWADETDLDCYMTAHHADDQLETILMRLNRGSGVGGLASIRARQGKLVRPLLGWRRSELAAIVEGAGITPLTDPSNSNYRFDRARLRKAIANADWLNPAAASASAFALADADAALEWATKTAAKARVQSTGGEFTLNPHDLPKEILRRLVQHALTSVAPKAEPRGEALSRLIATLSEGGTATLGGARCQGGEVWRFTPAPPRRGN